MKRSRKSRIIEASVIGLVLLACAGVVVFLGIKVASPTSSSNGSEPVKEEPVRVLTHDEAVGPPLTFETPAYIRIPVIEVDEEVREGSDDEEAMYQILAQGPIHITHTGFPGQTGNCVISGHRTTKTRPFNRLDEVKAGDAIVIDNPRGRYEYQVYSVFAIDPSEDVTLPTEDSVITLTTCHPEGNATQRLVVRGLLTGFTPIEYMP